MNRAPSPPAAALLGHARPFQRDPLDFLLRTAREFGPVVRLRLGPLVYHLVTGPAEVERVLSENAANYRRDTRSSRNIRLVTGESLLTTEGETWRRHRRLAQPIFHHRRLAALGDMIAAATRQVVGEWERVTSPIDLAAEMTRLTFLVVGRCLFGTDLGSRSDTVERAMPILLSELFRRAGQVFSLPLWLPTSRHRAFRAALASVDEVVGQVIASHRAMSGERADLLSLLLAARDEDGSALSDAEVRNHTITFLLAGHETTASTLTWTLCLLDQHPDILTAVEEELSRELHGKDPGLEDLPRLRLLDAVLRESLRLYPSIWIAERSVAQDDTLGGYAIPGGSTVVLSAYATHRVASYWEKPDVFQPGRFLGRDEMPGVKDGYVPFGAGPHVCIGQHFAVMESKLVLATLLQRFRIRRLETTFPALVGGITLRPRDAVPATLERRR